MAGQRVHGSELAGAFASLRANDLVWNYVVNNYLKGETPPAFDLLLLERRLGEPAGADVRVLPAQPLPRQPAARARCAHDGRRARSTSRGSTVPTYVFATREDHIVPWRSAYRTTGLFGGDVTFVLGASGHIAGVDQPGGEEPAQLLDERAGDRRRRTTGSSARRTARAAGGRTGRRGWPGTAARCSAAPQRTGSGAHPPLEPAPGSYVRESAG